MHSRAPSTGKVTVTGLVLTGQMIVPSASKVYRSVGLDTPPDSAAVGFGQAAFDGLFQHALLVPYRPQVQRLRAGLA